MTRFEAQRKLGLFAPHDYVTITLIGAILVTVFFWWVFGQPSLPGLLLAVGGLILLFQIWIVVLAYRVLVFMLDMQADINLMPETAARIVQGYRAAAASAVRKP